MSVRKDASGDTLEIPHESVQDNGDWTICCWIRGMGSGYGDGATMFYCGEGFSVGVSFRVDASGNLYRGHTGDANNEGTAIASWGASTPTDWTFVVLQREDTGGSYDEAHWTWGLEGGSLSTASLTNGFFQDDETNIEIGKLNGTYWGDLEVAKFRAWNAFLSQSELESEFESATPVRTANLVSDIGLDDSSDNVEDVSGGIGPFTTSGTITTGADDPDNWGGGATALTGALNSVSTTHYAGTLAAGTVALQGVLNAVTITHPAGTVAEPATGIAVGERFVRRHQAARTSTANATAADITYDTAEISDNAGYAYAAPAVTPDTAGKYLAIFDLGQADLASTRAVGTLVPRIGGVDQTRYRATHRYLRNSGGQQGASIGAAILDLDGTEDVRVRNPGALTPTDAVGNYATNVGYGGALQLLRLPDGDFTEVQRTVDAAEVGQSNINTTRPWIDTSGSWTKITYDTEVVDDAGLYPGTGGDLTLAANTKYLLVWGATHYSTDASRHTYVTALNIAGTRRQTSTGYQRNTASQGPPTRGVYLHETGGVAETAYLEATHEIEGGDAGTPQCADAYLQVIELPATAEWIHVDNGATDSLTTALAGTTTWYDTPLGSTLRADGNSDLSLDSPNNAVQNDSGGVLPVLAIGWHRWDRDGGGSGTRKMPWTRWNNGGAAVGYGIAGAYSRGQQSNDDTWQAHYVAAALLDLADAADLSLQVNDEASGANSDMGVYASASRHFLGVQVLNLDSLTGGGGPSLQALTGVRNDITVTLPAGTVTPGPIGLAGAPHSVAITHPAGQIDTQTALTGAAHAVTVAHPAGTLSPGPVALQGVLHAVTVAHSAGTVAAGATALQGVLHAVSTTHTAGTITAGAVALTGAAHAVTIAHTAGTLAPGAVQLTGAAHTALVAHFAGTIASGTPLQGAAHAVAVTHSPGVITPGPVAIAGAAHAVAITHPAGVISAGSTPITGAPHTAATAHFAGTLTAGTAALAGTLHPIAIAHPAGTVAAGENALIGAAHAVAITHPAGTITPGPVALQGTPHTAAVTHPAGQLAAGSNALIGQPHNVTITHPTGTLTPGTAALSGADHPIPITHPAGTLTPTYQITDAAHNVTITHHAGTITTQTGLQGILHTVTITADPGTITAGAVALQGAEHAIEITWYAAIITGGQTGPRLLAAGLAARLYAARPAQRTHEADTTRRYAATSRRTWQTGRTTRTPGARP